MAPKKIEVPEGEVFFAVVEDPDVVLYRTKVVYINSKDRTDPETGEYLPGVCRSAEANKEGLYRVPEIHEYRELMYQHLKIRADRDECPIIGPFATRPEALVEREIIRPKTEEEKGMIAQARVGQLEKENEELRKVDVSALAEEVAALKKRLKKAEAKPEANN